MEFWRSISCFDYPDYARAAARSFEKHLWYLSPRLIALAFFDDNITLEEKRELKNAFMAAQNSNSNPNQTKKTVPTRAAGICMSDTLATFVTINTKDFFDVMQISTEFMQKHESEWAQEESFKIGQRRAASLQVTNDVAERGVKLVSDVNQRTTRDPTQQAYLLQVIESHRQRFPKKW